MLTQQQIIDKYASQIANGTNVTPQIIATAEGLKGILGTTFAASFYAQAVIQSKGLTAINAANAASPVPATTTTTTPTSTSDYVNIINNALGGANQGAKDALNKLLGNAVTAANNAASGVITATTPGSSTAPASSTISSQGSSILKSSMTIPLLIGAGLLGFMIIRRK
jgi:hypothetical protein